MDENRIHLQGVVWTFGEHDLPALLLDGHALRDGTPDDGALLAAAQTCGLPLTTDLHHLPLAPVPGWRIEAEAAPDPLGHVGLTVRWPRPRPLIDRAGVRLPTRWQQLAVTRRTVLLLAGRDLVTGPGELPARAIRLAEAGLLTAGVVAFRSAPRGGPRQEPRSPALTVMASRAIAAAPLRS